MLINNGAGKGGGNVGKRVQVCGGGGGGGQGAGGMPSGGNVRTHFAALRCAAWGPRC